MNHITLCPNCETNFDENGFCCECGLHAEQLEPPSKRNLNMKNITVSISKKYDEKIHELIEMGVLSSRSETVRLALREFLTRSEIFHKWMDADSSSPKSKKEKKIERKRWGMNYL